MTDKDIAWKEDVDSVSSGLSGHESESNPHSGSASESWVQTNFNDYTDSEARSAVTGSTLPGHLRRGNNYLLRTIPYNGNNSDQLWLLGPANTGDTEVIGSIYGQRSSGHWGAAKVDILFSSSSNGNPEYGYVNTQQVLRSNEQYNLVTCTYNTTEYIALRYEGQSYSFTGNLWFEGYAKGDSNTLTNVVSSEVSNISYLDNAETKETTKANLFGIGTSDPKHQLDVPSGRANVDEYLNIPVYTSEPSGAQSGDIALIDGELMVYK